MSLYCHFVSQSVKGDVTHLPERIAGIFFSDLLFFDVFSNNLRQFTEKGVRNLIVAEFRLWRCGENTLEA